MLFGSSVELTDRTLRGIASNAFNGCKMLKRVKITFPEWGGYFDEYERWVGYSRRTYPLVCIVEKPCDFDPFGQTGLSPLATI